MKAKDLKVKAGFENTRIGGGPFGANNSKKLTEATPEELVKVYNQQALTTDLNTGKLTKTHYPYRKFFEGDGANLEDVPPTPLKTEAEIKETTKAQVDLTASGATPQAKKADDKKNG